MEHNFNDFTNHKNNIYYEKYKKYKKKYLDLQTGNEGMNEGMNEGGNGNIRHNCHPKNKYNEICVQNIKGHYKSKKSCVNDCENKYINHHLTRANIKGETLKFHLFIKDIIKNENIDVYIKGGNVIGLYVLKMIYNKYYGTKRQGSPRNKDNDDKFKKSFNEFLKLELMKDWDFAAYTKNKINKEYRNKLDKIAKKYKLTPRAKTFILYQTYKPILIDKKALFEIAIVDSDAYSTLELPMTTMKIKVHEYNLKYFYMFAKSFLSHKLIGEDFDFNILKKIINSVNVVTHPHKNGLYDPDKHFDKGGLNEDIVNFIKSFSKKDTNIAQFLVIHMEDPYRLLYRLPEKNIPKTDKIKDFIKKELPGSKMPSWLMDTDKISKIVRSFAKALGHKINDIYSIEFKKNKSVNKSIGKVAEFMTGVKFNRTLLEYNNFSDENKEILNLIFKPLIDTAQSKQIEQLEQIDQLETSKSLIKLLKFLNNKL